MQHQYRYCFDPDSPFSLVMLVQPENIAQLLLTSPPAKIVFVWIPTLSDYQTIQKAKTIFKDAIIIKNNILEIEYDIKQKRLDSCFILICSQQTQSQAEKLLSQYEQLKHVVYYPAKDQAKSFSTELFHNTVKQFKYVTNDHQLFGVLAKYVSIEQKQQKYQKKILKNFINLNNEVDISNKLTRSMHAMLNQSIDRRTRIQLVNELQQMLNLLRQRHQQFQRNKYQLQQFFNCLRIGLSKQEAIKWYTRDTPIYKIISNILRSAQQPTQVFYIQPYFRDLFNAIKSQYQLARGNNYLKSFTCYRGGIISQEELYQFQQNIGGVVQNRAFLSTSSSRMVASQFAQNVLFEIAVNQQNINPDLTNGFAQINKFSCYTEQEVLFNPLNSFQIVDIETIGHRHYIKLKYGVLVQIQREEEKKIYCQGDAFIGSCPLQGDLQYWQKYSDLIEKKTHQTHSTQYYMPRRKAHYCFAMGKISQTRGGLSFTQNYYQKPSKIVSQFGYNNIEYANTLNNFAINLSHSIQYRRAAKYLQDCLRIYKFLGQQKSQNYVNTLMELGNSQSLSGKINKARTLYQTAQKIIISMQKSKMHPQYAKCINNIAKTYFKQKQYQRALKNYQQALQIYQKFQGKNSLFYCRCLVDIAKVYNQKEQFHEALPIWQSAKQLIQKMFGKKHSLYLTIIKEIKICKGKNNSIKDNENDKENQNYNKQQTQELGVKQFNFCCNPSNPDTLVMLKPQQQMVSLILKPDQYEMQCIWEKDQNGQLIPKEKKSYKHKYLPNFIIIGKEVHISNILARTMFAMLNQYIDSTTRSLIIDQLQKFIQLLKQKNYQFDKDNQVFKHFFLDLRNQNGMQPEKALQWYTRESFIYKILNNLLRTSRNPTETFYIQPFFKSLFHAIFILYRQRWLSQKAGKFTCYRGGLMKKEQIIQFENSIGQVVQSFSFLSTSLSSQTAKRFTHNVKFQIQVNQQHLKQGLFTYGYADISKYSQPNQEQILFNPLNYFTIISVEKQAHNQGKQIYFIKLKHGEPILEKKFNEPTTEEQNFRLALAQINYSESKKIICQGSALGSKYHLKGEIEYWLKLNDLQQLQTYRMSQSNENTVLKLNFLTRKGLCLNQIGMAYQNIDNLPKSLQYLKQALKFFRFQTINYAQVLNNIGLVLKKQGFVHKSLKYFQEYLRITVKLQGNQSQNYSLANSHVGSAWLLAGNYNKAIKYILNSKQTILLLCGKMHPKYARITVCIATMYDQLEQLETALKFYTQSLQIYQKLQGKCHKDYYNCLHGIAKIQGKKGQFDKAITILKEAQMLIKSRHGIIHPHYCMVLQTMSYFCSAKRDHQTALQFSQEVVNISQEIYGQQNHYYAVGLVNLAQKHSEIGELQKCYSLCQKALNIFKRLNDTNSPHYPQISKSIADIYSQFGDQKKSIQLYQEALRVYSTSRLSFDHATVKKIAEIHFKRRNYPQSLKNYEKCREIIKNKFGTKNLKYVSILNNIAVVYFYQKQYQNAIQSSEQSEKIIAKILGKKHHKYQDIIKKIQIFKDYAQHQKPIQDINFQQSINISFQSKESILTKSICNNQRLLQISLGSEGLNLVQKIKNKQVTSDTLSDSQQKLRNQILNQNIKLSFSKKVVLDQQKEQIHNLRQGSEKILGIIKN